MEIGPALKTAREKQAISLEVAEKETKIRKKYLIALEQENFDIIPGKVYVRGFLRNYARFLGLNSEDLVNQYNNYAVSQEDETLEQSKMQETYLSQKSKKRFALVALAGLVVFLGMSILLSSMVGGNDTPGNNVSHENKKPPAPQSASPPVNNSREHNNSGSTGSKDKINQPASSEGVDLVLTFYGRCWMEVRVDKKKVFEGFAYSGESKEFSGQENITVHVGNAGVVRATVNGTEKGFLGEKADVVTRTFRPEGKANT